MIWYPKQPMQIEDYYSNENMMPEIHLFILWEKARVAQEKILSDIAMHFTIVKQYEITWTRSLVASNFTRFCGTRLGDNLEYKIANCGKGEFLVVIVRDEDPVYQTKDTFHGAANVNIKMFEAKQRYREWTGGGVRVHATDNTIETNHDLVLLIGKNVADFIASNSTSKVEKFRRDLMGARGWTSIEQLFYVMNNTVRYAVMRGYGELATGDFIDHGDTDILTDDYENLWLIVNSPKYNISIKPKAQVKIGKTIYLLDIWNCGRNGYNYFDPVWVQQMLDSAIEWRGMKVLNPENDFYCLLYHCLTNKGHIAEDYMPKLQRYKREFCLTEADWHKLLVNFLKSKSYEVIRPIDANNPFNISNPNIAGYALRNGGVCIYVDIETQSRVYIKGDHYIIKSTTGCVEIGKDMQYALILPIKDAQKSNTARIKALCAAILPKKVWYIASKMKNRLTCKH